MGANVSAIYNGTDTDDRPGIAGIQLDSGSSDGSLNSSFTGPSLPGQSGGMNDTTPDDLGSASSSGLMGNASIGAGSTLYISHTSYSKMTFAQPSASVIGVAGVDVDLGENEAANATTNTTEGGFNTNTLNSSTAALNAAIAFFAVEVDPTCDKDCGTWRGLSNVSVCRLLRCVCDT